MNGRGLLDIAAGVVAAVGCLLSWLAASSTIDVAPVLPGEPATTSVVYSGPLLALAFVLATAAGVLLVLGIARLRR
ncbi:hypothetical protein ACWDTP_09605 [Mycobacterium sp. NPDC003449]